MDWETYETEYTIKAKLAGIPIEIIEENLSYALNLHKQNLPIIYDQKHFSFLIGIKYEYLLKVSNSPLSSYRTFNIIKSNGRKRTIHEPLPSLKIIQQWILTEILDSIEISPFAKAYKKGLSIKDNIKFHRKQKKVLRLDITDFFDALKQKKVLKIFLDVGYSMDVSVLLAKLCTVNGKLPQGAPTSAYISNVILKKFDYELSKYCNLNKIRYTRYADDMTFSGDFKENKLISKVVKTLGWYNLELNEEKTSLMRQHNRQLVTGITVNNKIQVRRNVRRSIRQEIFFIKKFGIIKHLNNINVTDSNPVTYLKSLKGKVDFCIFINPKDEEMMGYRYFLQEELLRY